MHEVTYFGTIVLVVAAGFTPCSGAVLILLFAFTNGILVMGVVMALTIAAGMAVTLSLLGIAGVVAHHQVRARFPGRRNLRVVLSFAGPALITLAGVVLLSGAVMASGPL